MPRKCVCVALVADLCPCSLRSAQCQVTVDVTKVNWVNKNDEKGQGAPPARWLRRRSLRRSADVLRRLFAGSADPRDPSRIGGRRAYRFVNRLVYSTTAIISISTIASG